MTAQLVRLRIAGFKSFAEPASLDILPGLTGIVGPNGCGKSNVVEALRWAMGETSARSLRGGEMDDVIFAGTTARASRNLAEVTVTLGGTLPAPYEAEPELQVTRRIERGAGSQFRANGRELRARDVQTLYADLASGARSSGMVSQGRVAALVGARPEDRRQVLEEAAGITGLHARRHEAELKLRAAEQNLARAEELRAQLQGAQDGLRKQARQAARYRDLSALVRAAEAGHLAVLLAAAHARLAAEEAAHATARADADAAAGAAGAASLALDAAEAALSGPRAALAASARTLERARMSAENLTAEAEREARDAAEAERRLLDLQADLAAADRARTDSEASVTRLRTEAARLEASLAGMAGLVTQAADALAMAAAEADAAETAAEATARAALQASLAEEQARASQAAAAGRRDRVRAQHDSAEADHTAAAAALVADHDVAEAASAADAAEILLLAACTEQERAEAERAASASGYAEADGRAARLLQARRAAEHSLEDAAERSTRLDQALLTARATLAALQAGQAGTGAQAARAAAALARGAAETGEQRFDAAGQDLAGARQRAAEAARTLADLSAAVTRADAALADAQARAGRSGRDRATARTALDAALREAPAPEVVAHAATALSDARQALATRQAERDAARQACARAAAAEEAARSAHDAARSETARLDGVVAGLRSATQGFSAGDARAVLADMDVPPGLEAALGAALGASGEASLDPAGQRFWCVVGDGHAAPRLPEGAVPLGSLVRAPAALARALAWVAVLDDDANGAAVQAALPPGAVAVTRQGACWRWDGYVTRAGAPNPAASHLGARRRLAEASAALESARARAAAEASALDAAGAAHQAARARAARAEEAHGQASTGAQQAHEVHQGLAAQADGAGQRAAALHTALGRLDAEHAVAEHAVTLAGQACAALPACGDAQAAARAAAADALAAEAALSAARDGRQAARDALAAAQATQADLDRQVAETDARIAASAPLLDELAAEARAAGFRLAAAQAALAALPALHDTEAALEAASEREASARAAEAAARAGRQQAEAAASAARQASQATRARQDAAADRHGVQAGLLARTAQDLAAATQALDEALAHRAGLADAGDLAEAARAATAAQDAAREARRSAAARLETLQRSAVQAQAALDVTRAELGAWQARWEEAAGRVAALTARGAAARAAWQALGTAPEQSAARACASAAALARAEAAHADAAGQATAAEDEVRARLLAHRAAEQRAASCREDAVRAEAGLAAAGGAMRAVLDRSAARLGADAALPGVADHSDAAEERARRRHERLSREREEVGPVNLRAELELAELDERLAALQRERDELGTAVAKLRGAIGHLNREGRARLAAVFAEVDQHFRTLFTRMMGGGRAHLALTGSDDPLQAGLEIYAEPPGKKLAALSLLSGGEQALTALSLIFAVFRCTPAPISVLDEVDAPLDDANVERFCTLLDDVVRDTGTRFLVVTHHQLTMSRMDRLFGVTMQERGVSRLLSVDLGRAAAMAGPVLQAAE